MRRFVVAVGGLSADGERAFLQFLGDRDVGWWHRIDKFWLLVDKNDFVTALEIRDELHKLSNSADNGVVMQIPEDITWAGFSGEGEAFYTWIKTVWAGKTPTGKAVSAPARPQKQVPAAPRPKLTETEN